MARLTNKVRDMFGAASGCCAIALKRRCGGAPFAKGRTDGAERDGQARREDRDTGDDAKVCHGVSFSGVDGGGGAVALEM